MSYLDAAITARIHKSYSNSVGVTQNCKWGKIISLGMKASRQRILCRQEEEGLFCPLKFVWASVNQQDRSYLKKETASFAINLATLITSTN